jgi:hypothetical protein
VKEREVKHHYKLKEVEKQLVGIREDITNCFGENPELRK